MQFKKIPEFETLTPEQFFEEVVPRQSPIVIRDFASKWPIVVAAKLSPKAFVDYLMKFYNGKKTNVLLGHPSIKGHFFYNEDCSDLNFIQGKERLDLYLGRLLELAGKEIHPAVSVQSISPEELLPGLVEDNKTDFFPETLPRLWIGNKTVVSAHFDSSDNIACVVSGRRRFILFPPEQVANLYPGSLNFTPSGVPVSMVDLYEPDFDKYPRFKNALAGAYSVELNPGDAIFIPMLWWHHVDALEKVNCLMNYWWNGAFSSDAPSPKPIDALNMAMLSMRNLSALQLEGWRCMFDHYLFRKNVDPASYVPEHCQYTIGSITAEAERKIKDDVIERLKL